MCERDRWDRSRGRELEKIAREREMGLIEKERVGMDQDRREMG